ncbi:MAG: M48 family metalloprotease [Rhodospirillales bacterium]|nr:M48 family metalloprotease [Rhodospirillales bacterium]
MFSFLFILSAALLPSACAPTTQTPNISNSMAAEEVALQRELAVKENTKMAQRLENIAAPILLANAPLCEDMVAPYVGAHFITKDAVHKDYRETMAKLYGVDSRPTVTMIAEKTPASKVLKVGDMITHVDGQTLPEGKAGLKKLETLLNKNEVATPMKLTLDRAGKSVDVTLNPVHACNSPVTLAMSDAVNAAADGKNIIVTKGMMRFVENDTELATVVGHELAHNTRAHVAAKSGNAIIGGILGAVVTVATGVDVTDLGMQIGAGVNSQGFEAEADYVGLYHTARAGYNIDQAPNLWRRMAASNPGAIHMAGGSHPSTAKRFLALEATVKEIKSKKAKGQKLVPEERQVQPAQATEHKPGGND